MKKAAKFLSVFLSLVMILSVCGMCTVFAEGEYKVAYGTNNMIRIENTTENTLHAAGVAREYAINVPADGTYYVILGKTINGSAYDTEIAVDIAFTQAEQNTQTINYTLGSTAKAKTSQAVERVGNHAVMTADLVAGACTVSVTAGADTGFNYIELRDTMLKITGEKQVISTFDFAGANLNDQHVNDQVAYGTSSVYPDGYELIGNYLDDTLFDQSTTSSNRKTRYIHVNANCYATYNVDVQAAGYYQIGLLMNLYSATFPRTSTLTVNVDGAAASSLSYTKETSTDASRISPTRAIYLTAGEHTIELKNNSGTGAYAYYMTIEPTDASKAVKVDDNFTRIEFAKKGSAETFNETDGLDFSTAVDLLAGTYAVFVKKPVAYYGSGNTYTVALADGEIKTYTAATNQDSKASGFTYERIGDSIGATFSVPESGEVNFDFAVSNACDVEYIDIRRLEIPLTGDKQAISVADFATVQNLSAAHCSQQFHSGATTHVLKEYPLVGDYFSSLITPRDKYATIHLSGTASVGYTVDVQAAGWYSFGMLINTYKSNGVLSMYADGSLVDAARYTYISTPQEDLAYTYNAVYLTEGPHVISFTAENGIYLYRFTSEKLEGDPIYEFSGEIATVMHTGMTTEGEIDGAYRVLNANETASFRMNNVYTDPDGDNTFTMKLAVDTAGISDAKVSIQIGEATYDNIAVGGVSGDAVLGKLVLPAGESAVTITSQTDGVKIKSFSVVETTIPVSPTGNTVLSIARASELSAGVTPNSSGVASFTAEQLMEFDVDVVEEGIYTLRMIAQSPQTGFTVYVDEANVTDAQNLITDDTNTVNAAKNGNMTKNAATNLALSAGAHKVKVVFHDVAEEAVTHTVNEIFLRRVDKTVARNGYIQLGSWDYTALKTQKYWSLPAQVHQGITYKGDELYRNIVFMAGVAATYTFNVAEDGFYNISTFGTGPADATQAVRFAIDGGENAPDTTFGYIGESAGVENIFQPQLVYLAAGQHTITVSASNPSTQPVRLHAVQILWADAADEIAVDSDSMQATYKTTQLEVAEDAVVYLAAYKANRLVGIDAVNVTASTKTVYIEADVNAVPDTVKVLVLNDALKPLKSETVLVGN